MQPTIDDRVRLILRNATQWGADLAGVASVDELKRSPSHAISARLPEYIGVGSKHADGRRRGVVTWPEGTRSAIVIAAAHPPGDPELDWWVASGPSTGNTAGNRRMMKTVARLAAWLERDLGMRCVPLPYHIEHGGVFMKDAAVLAGLGCIGKNNLLITPGYGPRVRLRVMLTDAVLPSTGASGFDPCDACPMPCRAACPQDAFAERITTAKEFGQSALPGRSGMYDRSRCNRQMVTDESNAEALTAGDREPPAWRIKYCRECELACPAGSL